MRIAVLWRRWVVGPRPSAPRSAREAATIRAAWAALRRSTRRPPRPRATSATRRSRHFSEQLAQILERKPLARALGNERAREIDEPRAVAGRADDDHAAAAPHVEQAFGTQLVVRTQHRV